MPRAIVIVSGKGGTGKTSLAAGLGCALSAMGKRCVCIDGDIGLPSLDMALGLGEFVAFDFADVAADVLGLQEALLQPEAWPGLQLLSAPPRIAPEERNLLRGVVRRIKREIPCDYILIDAGAGLGLSFDVAVRAADSAIVVATADPVSLRGANTTAQRLYDMGVEDAYLVVNRVRRNLTGRYDLPNIDDAIDLTELPLLGCVPEDRQVLLAQAAGESVLERRKSTAARAYRSIAKRITGEYVPLGI